LKAMGELTRCRGAGCCMVDGGLPGKSADTNVTEDHEHLRDHEPLRVRSNWSRSPNQTGAVVDGLMRLQRR
jgi:hypothetical protein